MATCFTEKADLMAVIEGVKKQFSPTGISLLGCSQGGFVSGLVAADLGEKVKDRLTFYYMYDIPPVDFCVDGLHLPTYRPELTLLELAKKGWFIACMTAANNKG